MGDYFYVGFISALYTGPMVPEEEVRRKYSYLKFDVDVGCEGYVDLLSAGARRGSLQYVMLSAVGQGRRAVAQGDTRLTGPGTGEPHPRTSYLGEWRCRLLGGAALKQQETGVASSTRCKED